MIESAIFKRVVVGLDETGRSDTAVAAGLELSERLGANLTLVHAVDLPQGFLSWLHKDTGAFAYAEAIQHARTAQTQHLESCLTDHAHGPIDDLLVVGVGKPAKVLLDNANPADLIVLGPHALRGVLDFGSTLRTVLAETSGCVWVQKEEPRSIERILVATDHSRDSLFAAEAARKLASALNAKIAFVNAFSPPILAYPTGTGFPSSNPTYTVDHQRDLARKQFDATVARCDWGAAVDPIFREGDPADVILEVAGENDLVVVGSHGRTRLSHSVIGSVAYSVLKRANCPVLAVRHAGRLFVR